jgi:hypothetical protein
VPLVEDQVTNFYQEVVDKNGRSVLDANRRRTYKPSITYKSSICIKVNAAEKTIPSADYHNDNVLFQILQYSNKSKPYTLSTELLMYHNMEEIETRSVHSSLEKGPDGNPYFPPEIMGPLVHDRYEMVKRIYREISDGLTVLRFKLNKNDTVVFPDTLWKHAATNKNEQIIRNESGIANKMKIEMYRYVSKEVNICQERIRVSEEDVVNRQLILLSCYKNDYYMDPEGFSPEFEFKIQDAPGPSPEAIPVPEINLSEGHCVEFFKLLNRGDSCISLGPVNVFNRGGNANRFKRRNPYKRRRTNKKRRTNKRRRTRAIKNQSELRKSRK